MHRAEKIKALFERFGKSVPICRKVKMLGLIHLTRHDGFLWVSEEPVSWNVFLAREETSHNLLDGPVFGADFRKDNGERLVVTGLLGSTGVWKTAINLHPVRDEDEAVKLFNHVAQKVDLAFDFHFPQVH